MVPNCYFLCNWVPFLLYNTNSHLEIFLLAEMYLFFQSCSFFTSNAVPLKLVFKNATERVGPVYAMFKVGDDLRQDMMTMQVVQIMDRLWLKQGLDLKMVTFSCLPTGPKKGT